MAKPQDNNIIKNNLKIFKNYLKMRLLLNQSVSLPPEDGHLDWEVQDALLAESLLDLLLDK
jgi:hypothetical protein